MDQPIMAAKNKPSSGLDPPCKAIEGAGLPLIALHEANCSRARPRRGR